MAATYSPERKLMTKPGSFMLKDYLRDELSSCSSNGFGSFPRRQCCTTTTVRFLLEIDLKVKDSSITKRLLPQRTSRKIALTTISTFQRASEAVIRAFKQLPFRSREINSSSPKNRARKGFLPRSLSRKLLLRAFWKRADHIDNIVEREPDIGQWKSFQEFLDEKEKDSHSSATITVASRNSTSSISNSISWTESEFTSEMMVFSGGNSESSSENDAGEGEKDSPGNPIGVRDGVTVGKDSMKEATTTAAVADPKEIAKPWPSEEEKEQFSPVSVLDFSFDDEDQHGSSSSFNCSLHLIEGNKQKQNQKTKRFQNVSAQLEPLDLQKRFTDVELHHHVHGSISTEDQHQTETKPYELLKLVKSKTKSHCFIFHTENLLLDFFHEKLEEISEPTTAAIGRSRRQTGDVEEEALKMTEDWINNGKSGEMVTMEWGMQEGRRVYVKDMEKEGKWRDFGDEKQELAMEFEAEVWISLLNELLIDFSS